MSKKTLDDYLYYALLYLVLFFAAADLSSRVILKGEIITLPNLAGKTVEEAKTQIKQKKTSLVIQGYQFDSRNERGRIISQEPPAGSRVKVNRTVKVVLSEGSEKVEVPRFLGRSMEWASQTLKSANLRKGRVSQIHTSQYAAGRILAQDPPAAEVVSRNAAVDFLVSQGAWEEKYLMPDLIEKNANAVLRKLREMEFKVTEIHYSYYPGLGPGIILKQSPVHGFRIQKRNQIVLEVSK